MSDSVKPHRRQATRLPLPWDSPGKNTGVGWHCLLRNGTIIMDKCHDDGGGALVAKFMSNSCDHTGPPGSSVHGISQASILEWVAISFSKIASYICSHPRMNCNVLYGLWVILMYLGRLINYNKSLWCGMLTMGDVMRTWWQGGILEIYTFHSIVL